MTKEDNIPGWAIDERYRYCHLLSYGQFLEELRHRAALFGDSVRLDVARRAVYVITGKPEARFGIGALSHRFDIAPFLPHANYRANEDARKYAGTPQEASKPDGRSGVVAITTLANGGILMALDLLIAKKWKLINITHEEIAGCIRESTGINRNLDSLEEAIARAIRPKYLDTLRNNLFKKGAFHAPGEFKWPQKAK